MNTSAACITPLAVTAWNQPIMASEQTDAIDALEKGQVLFLPSLHFSLSPTEQALLTPEYVDPRAKNISFNYVTRQLKGANADTNTLMVMADLLTRFADQAQQLILGLFPSYQPALEWGRTSLRPVEITTRRTSYRKDDRLLHVDAFPASPNQGRRILRVFSNINLQQQPRIWRVGEPFAVVAQRFLPGIAPPIPGVHRCLHWLGVTKTCRTAYDHFMLQLHNRMKRDSHYQRVAAQTEVHFPAQTTWIVQTDQVSHAAMSGQHLLEQTFYLPVAAMQYPERSPLRMLEQFLNRPLARAITSNR